MNLITFSGVPHEKEFPEGDYVEPSRVFIFPWRLLNF